MRRCFAVLLLFFPLALQAQKSAHVLVISFDDTVQPVSTEYLLRGLAQAEREHDDAVLIRMNTPGGLLDSARTMTGAILRSPVPVITWVGPSGARAGSAGFFLLEASDVAAMAPGTNAGAAHPINGNGAPMDPILKEKLENDTAALVRSLANAHHRNLQNAEDAVRKSLSWSETEARDAGLIDLIAPDENALLATVDGRAFTRNGRPVTLHTAHAARVLFQPSLRERVLDPLMNPNLAMLILTAGVLLIYLEFNSPGTIVPGSLGALFVLLALFALNLLPLRMTAVALLIAALILIALEVKYTSHGVLGLAGVCALLFGTMTLVAAPIPELAIHWSTALALAVVFGGVTIFLLRLALRARRNKSKLGTAALIGESATAMESFVDPLRQGRILVHGELWQAECSCPVAENTPLRVIGARGLLLLTEPAQETNSAQERALRYNSR